MRLQSYDPCNPRSSHAVDQIPCIALDGGGIRSIDHTPWAWSGAPDAFCNRTRIRPWAVPHETTARVGETRGKQREAWGKTREAWGKTREAWGKTREAWGKAHETWGNAFEAWGNALEAWGDTNRLSGRCWNGSTATLQAWLVPSEASGPGPEAAMCCPRSRIPWARPGLR